MFNQCPKTFGDLSTCPLLAPFINKNKNCVVKGQIVNEVRHTSPETGSLG